MTSTTTETRITMALSEFAATLKWEDLSQDVIDKVKLCLLDALACGLYGSTLPWGQLVIKFGNSLGKGEESTVFGTGDRLPADVAALVNGTLAHCFEMDDLHKVAVIHPGSVVIPAVIAMAERMSHEGEVIDGKAFLLSVLVGYEIGCRVGLASGAIQLKRGFHPSATSGVFGAAAGAAKVLNLSETLTAHALGIAGTQSSGLMSAQYQAMAKRMNQGKSAQTGVYAALLAHMGFTGITNVLEAEYGGFFSTFADNVTPEDALVDLGNQYEVMNVGFKPYSCCGSNHTSVDVIRALKKDHPELKPDAVDHITIYTTTTTKKHVGWDYVPSGMTGAQMNLAYAVAVSLTDGECFIDQYKEDRLDDPDLQDLISRIQIIPVERLDQLGREGRHAIAMEVHLKDGNVLKGDRIHAKGSAHDPLTYEEVVAKYEKLAESVLPRHKRNALKEMILNLENCSDIRELTALLH